jgi:hypothetical protein
VTILYSVQTACEKEPLLGPGRSAGPVRGAAPDDRRDMRLILRLLGTWFVGIALILLIIDGTKSLGANAIVLTSLGEAWTILHAPSLEQLRAFLATRFFGPLLDIAVTALLTFPAWAVLGIPGLFIAWLGRSRRIRVFVKQDQF